MLLTASAIGGGLESTIEFVGSKVYNWSSETDDPLVDFNGLENGIATSAEPGDAYFLWMGEYDLTAGVPGFVNFISRGGTTTYTETLNSRQNDGMDSAVRAGYGIVGDPNDDCQIIVGGGTRGRTYILLVYRGVDNDSPLMAEPAIAGSTNSPNAFFDPMDITGPGLLVAIGSGGHNEGSVLFNNPYDDRLTERYHFANTSGGQRTIRVSEKTVSMIEPYAKLPGETLPGADSGDSRLSASVIFRPAAYQPDEEFHFSFDGRDGAVAAADWSDGNAFAVFRGSAALSNAHTNVNDTTSLYLDGVDDHVDIYNDRPNSIDFMENADATFEISFRPDAISGTQTLLNKHDGSLEDQPTIRLVGGEIDLEVMGTGVQSVKITSTTAPITALAWNHVAIQYDLSADTWSLYCNGNLIGSATPSQEPSTNSGPFTIGQNNDTGERFAGHIEQARWTNSLVYSGSTYTIPTAKHTEANPKAAAPIPDFASVMWLPELDGTDGQTAFTDASSKLRTITTGGSAQLDDTQKKFGTTSLLLASATSDYISVPDSSELTIHSHSGFCTEAWVRPTTTALGKLSTIFCKRDTSGSEEFTLNSNGSGTVQIATFNSSALAVAVTENNILSADTWYHVVGQRVGYRAMVFVDGDLAATDWLSADTFAATNAASLSLGRSQASGDRDWDGWIDEARVCTGFAYPPQGFIPPTAAHPRS